MCDTATGQSVHTTDECLSTKYYIIYASMDAKAHQRQYASHGFRADSSLLCVCVFVSDSGKSGRARGILVYFHCLWAIFFFCRCTSLPGTVIRPGYDPQLRHKNDETQQKKLVHSVERHAQRHNKQRERKKTNPKSKSTN